MSTLRERNAEWLAETPGGEEWTSARRGRALFDFGMDRRNLLVAGDALAEAIQLDLADCDEDVCPSDSGCIVQTLRAALAAWKVATG